MEQTRQYGQNGHLGHYRHKKKEALARKRELKEPGLPISMEITEVNFIEY